MHWRLNVSDPLSVRRWAIFRYTVHARDYLTRNMFFTSYEQEVFERVEQLGGNVDEVSKEKKENKKELPNKRK